MGTFPSPLQAANAIRVGWLLNYPIGVDCLLLAQELMRLFDFQIPIALEPAYPINPTATGKNWKRGKRQALHVFTAAPRAPEVVQRLLTALSKETPKYDMPFGADTRFVYDWKAVRARTIGVEAGPAISDFIVQMIATHDTFGSSTCLIRPNFTLTPLVQNSVPLFDEDMSLLRLLYAILCTPKQAQQAADQQAQEQTDQEHPNELEGQTDGDATMTKTSEEDEGQPSDPPDETMGKDAEAEPAMEQQTDGQTDTDPPTKGASQQESSTKPDTDDSKMGHTEETSTTTQQSPNTPSGQSNGTTQDSTNPEPPPTAPDSSPRVPSPPRLRNTANQADSTSQQISSLTGTPLILQTPQAPKETEEAIRSRLRKKDQANLRVLSRVSISSLFAQSFGRWRTMSLTVWQPSLHSILNWTRCQPTATVAS